MRVRVGEGEGEGGGEGDAEVRVGETPKALWRLGWRPPAPPRTRPSAGARSAPRRARRAARALHPHPRRRPPSPDRKQKRELSARSAGERATWQGTWCENASARRARVRGPRLQPTHSSSPSNLGGGGRASGELLGQLDCGGLCGARLRASQQLGAQLGDLAGLHRVERLRHGTRHSRRRRALDDGGGKTTGRSPAFFSAALEGRPFQLRPCCMLRPTRDQRS